MQTLERSIDCFDWTRWLSEHNYINPALQKIQSMQKNNAVILCRDVFWVLNEADPYGLNQNHMDREGLRHCKPHPPPLQAYSKQPWVSSLFVCKNT